MTKVKNLVLASLSFFMMMSIFIIGASLEYRSVVDEEKEKMEDELVLVKTYIEQTITSRMINANAIAGFVELNNGMTEASFRVFAESIYRSVNDVVKDVVFITDTTISHVYPSYYGAEAIGIDLAEVEEQRDILIYSKERNEPVFFGPVDLVEGGQGIIIRVPINVKRDYYGQLAIVFDYHKFIESSGISELGDKNVVVLEGADPLTGQMSEIWSNNGEESLEFLGQTLDLEGIVWLLKAVPLEGWRGDSYTFYTVLAIGFIFSIIVARVYHKQLVFKSQLIDANRDMTLTVDRLAKSEQQLIANYEEIKGKEAYIQYLADHDPLTKLYNRRLFREHLEASIIAGDQGYVILIDLDNFKNVNDIHGHVYGDSLLRSCTEIMIQVLKDQGKVYRFGGDEFLILIKDTVDIEVLVSIMDRITLAFSHQKIGQTTNHITFSSGIVTYPRDAKDVESLLIKVDIAMYRAKYAGKNQYAFFKDAMLEEFDVKIAIEEKLRQAIKEDGFLMHYQPIVDIESGEIVNFEALVRLKDFSYSPIDFIHVSEETGMIIPLGYWIIEDVMQGLRRLLDQGVTPKPIAINLSPKQLMEDDFVECFFEILERYDIASCYVEVEITESVFLENEEKNIAVLKDFHHAGIGISLDDFGTGYSSLNYLTTLPIDKVKLDKSMKDKFTVSKDPQVLTGMVDMSHGLGMKVVAEGVEELNEWDKLRHSGCDYLQGYYFSRPVAGEDMITLLNQKYLRQ